MGGTQRLHVLWPTASQVTSRQAHGVILQSGCLGVRSPQKQTDCSKVEGAFLHGCLRALSQPPTSTHAPTHRDHNQLQQYLTRASGRNITKSTTIHMSRRYPPTSLISRRVKRTVQPEAAVTCCVHALAHAQSSSRIRYHYILHPPHRPWSLPVLPNQLSSHAQTAVMMTGDVTERRVVVGAKVLYTAAVGYRTFRHGDDLSRVRDLPCSIFTSRGQKLYSSVSFPEIWGYP